MGVEQGGYVPSEAEDQLVNVEVKRLMMKEVILN